jgi:hypothetical protein
MQNQFNYKKAVLYLSILSIDLFIKSVVLSFTALIESSDEVLL